MGIIGLGSADVKGRDFVLGMREAHSSSWLLRVAERFFLSLRVVQGINSGFEWQALQHTVTFTTTCSALHEDTRQHQTDGMQ